MEIAPRTKIFSSAFFGPVQYFAHLASTEIACIEHHCHYSRQTYRNRFVIRGANGALPLSAPVVKCSGVKTVTKDTRLSYDTPWNQVAWKSIEAAYNSSPYFLYYKDDIEPIFSQKWMFLVDMNMAALKVAMDCTGIDATIKTTTSFINSYEDVDDLRELIHPKVNYQADSLFYPTRYRQVFEPEGEFIPNLSILDLIFNKGPESLLVLRDSIVARGGEGNGRY